MLLQVMALPFSVFIFLVFLPILIGIELIVLKIALVIVKAKERSGMKWVVISILAQIGMFLFVAIPLFLIGLTGGFKPESTFLIIIIIIVACFLDFNLINVIHRLGMKRAFAVFIFFLVPLIIIGFLLFYYLSAFGYIY